MTILEKANAILAEKEAKVLPENIKSGVKIFDITGTLIGLQEGSADATATAGDISIGKTAYVNGEKVEGTIVTFTELETYTLTSGIDNSTNVNSELGVVGEEGAEENVLITTTKPEADVLFRQNTTFKTTLTYANLAQLIGLTADKIKAGETILGITGTYTGETTTEPETGDDIIGEEEG